MRSGRMIQPMNRFGLPDLGCGLGLRSPHVDHVLRERPAVDWFELLTENVMASEGRPRAVAFEVAEHYPVALHGVSLSIGSPDPLDLDYLGRLKRLADELDARWVGDHVCFTGVSGENSHDLLPMPTNEAALRHLVARVDQVQQFLGRPLVLENPSTYVTFRASTMPEGEFLAALADQADCALLLDVNNIHVSSSNHGWDRKAYLDAIPYDRVVQIHLAGPTDKGTHLIDTHIGPVPDPVWALYEDVVRRAGPIATIVEWDDEIPTFDVLHAEAARAADIRAGIGGVA